jgi:hypothetical protein
MLIDAQIDFGVDLGPADQQRGRLAPALVAAVSV